MRPRWRKVAQLAWNPTFTPDQVAEVVPLALLEECNVEFVRMVDRALNPTDQTKLFEESPQEVAARLHQLRSMAPGSQFAENLIDAAIYGLYYPSKHMSVLESALPSALHATAESAIRGIEEHGLRKQGRETAESLRNRLNAADGLLDYNKIGAQLMAGPDGKRVAKARKRSGLDEGVSL